MSVIFVYLQLPSKFVVYIQVLPILSFQICQISQKRDYKMRRYRTEVYMRGVGLKKNRFFSQLLDGRRCIVRPALK